MSQRTRLNLNNGYLSYILVIFANMDIKDILKYIKAERRKGTDPASIVNEVFLTITGDVGRDFSGGDFIRYVRMFMEPTETINLDIFSFGGSPFDALAVYDFFNTTEYGIKNSNLYGMCGSAATILAAATNEGGVGIGGNSFMIVHNAFNYYTGEQDEQTKKISDQLLAIYKKKTGLSTARLKRIMSEGDDGYIMGAKEAVELGFADKILKEVKSVAAMYNDAFLASSNNIFSNPKPKRMDNILAFVTKFFGITAKSEEEALAALKNVTPETFTASANEGLVARLDALEQARADAGQTTEVDTSNFVTVEQFTALTGVIEKLAEKVGEVAEGVEANAANTAVNTQEDDKITGILAKIDERLNNAQTVRSLAANGTQGTALGTQAAAETNGGGKDDTVVSTGAADAIAALVEKTKQSTSGKVAFRRN